MEAKGFLKTVLTGIKIDPARTTDIPAIKLDVAAVQQTVEVSEVTQAVVTSNAEVATTITKPQIQNLPMLDRSPLGFLLTQAGINYGRGATTVNGQRSTYVNVTLDGINVQDNYIRTNDLDFLPNLLLLDQVAEVTVTTSNSGASAAGGSAQVTFVTPSGTNQYHGNLYWSNRNSALAANTWFNNQSNVAIPFLNQNQGGGSLGGPVFKNKLFFYTNYEAFRLKQQSTINATVPTADARQGIYTYRDSGGNVQKVNILRAMGVTADSTMAALLAKVPGPENINNNNVGDSTAAFTRNTAGYRFRQRSNRTRDNLTAKGDFLPSTKHSFSATYTWNRDINDRTDQGTTFGAFPTVQNDADRNLLSTSWRWSPKPNMTNEARFGFNLAPSIFLASAEVPQFYVTGMFYTNPINTFRSQGRYTNSFYYADNASYVRGPHTLTFGFQGQSLRIEPYNDAGITPSYGLGIGQGITGLSGTQLPGINSSDLSAANSMLASLAGYYSSYTQTYNVTSRTSGFVNGATSRRNLRYENLAFYAQDAWRLSRRVTATLGVRWDYYTSVDERDSLALFPVLQNGNAISTLMNPATTLDFAGKAVGKPWYNADKNNFAPNAGLAWDVFGNGKTAVRAGYSLSYVNDSVVQSLNNNQSTNAGLQQTVTASGIGGRFGGAVAAIPTPTFKVPRTLADNYAVSSSSAAGMPDPGLATPYVQQWSLGIQQAIKGTIVEVRYVGNHATKSIRGIDYNQVLINDLLPDFQKAQNNGLLAQRASGIFDPQYNANIAGSQQIPFFARLPNNGLLTNATVRSYIQTGQVGELGSYYQTARANGTVNFYRNPNILGANVLTNYSNSTYNGLQVDVTRRFFKGLQFQANYVYSKVMSDAAGNNQTNFEPFLDNNNPKIERSRAADYDITHVLKSNWHYELPMGPGRRFNYGPLNRVLGGWSVSGIFTMQSGTPFSVLSGRGTLNRAGRSANNTATTTLNKAELDELFQFRMTGTGPYFVAASALNPADGRAVASDGATPFAGQVFYQPVAGNIGALQRNYFSGPTIWDVDMKVSKVTRIREKHVVELRMDATNVFNHPAFYMGDMTITSTTFGKITSLINPGSTRRLLQFALYYRF